MSYIYKITNDINNKIYVGKTENTIEIRFKQHCNDAFRDKNEKRPLYSAMRKYGIEHFQIELVEETNNPEEREIYWINFYEGYTKGYNATIGGDGKLLYNHEQILNELKQGLTGKEVAEKIGCCPDIVYQIANKNNIDLKGGLNFLEKKKKISAYSKKDNEFLQSFDSTVAAAQWCYETKRSATLNSGVRSHIADVANGKRKSAYGCIWKYE